MSIFAQILIIFIFSIFGLLFWLGYKEGIEELAVETKKKKYYALAFNCYFILRDIVNCLECLLGSKKYPEAAFFAKSFCPSQISRIVELWKKSLQKTNPLIGKNLKKSENSKKKEKISKISTKK